MCIPIYVVKLHYQYLSVKLDGFEVAFYRFLAQINSELRFASLSLLVSLLSNDR